MSRSDQGCRHPLEESALAALFTRPAVVVVATRAMWRMPPRPCDERFVARAVESRRREFAAGRACARAALSRLGIHAAPLTVTLERFPIWPSGVVGSISHSGEACAAAVASTRDVVSIGLDIESAAPLPEDLAVRITTDRERELLRARTDRSEEASSKLVFSAKESFYKCHYPVHHRFLDFREVEVELDPLHPRFVARRLQPCCDEPPLEGRYLWTAEYVVTAVTWPLAGERGERTLPAP